MDCSGFKCCAEVRINRIRSSCADVSPCNNVSLTLQLFGVTKATSLKRAKFPVWIGEKLTFEKLFFTPRDLLEVANLLEDIQVLIELKGQIDHHSKEILLAFYETNARDFLYPFRSLATQTRDREVLLNKTYEFMGQPPILEFSTFTVIYENSETPNDPVFYRNNISSRDMNPTTHSNSTNDSRGCCTCYCCCQSRPRDVDRPIHSRFTGACSLYPTASTQYHHSNEYNDPYEMQQRNPPTSYRNAASPSPLYENLLLEEEDCPACQIQRQLMLMKEEKKITMKLQKEHRGHMKNYFTSSSSSDSGSSSSYSASSSDHPHHRSRTKKYKKKSRHSDSSGSVKVKKKSVKSPSKHKEKKHSSKGKRHQESDEANHLKDKVKKDKKKSKSENKGSEKDDRGNDEKRMSTEKPKDEGKANDAQDNDRKHKKKHKEEDRMQEERKDKSKGRNKKDKSDEKPKNKQIDQSEEVAAVDPAPILSEAPVDNITSE